MKKNWKIKRENDEYFNKEGVFLALYFILFFISITASTIGAITGIGGGILVKPVVDSLGVLSISTISFLSGCMVLSMSISSLIRNRNSNIKIDPKRIIFLAIGSAFGGVFGKFIFDYLINFYKNQQLVGVYQNIALLLLTIIVFLYTLNKYKIKTYNIKSPLVMLTCGLILGLISTFIGIGGGPINLLALSLLFSMDSKQGAMHSIFIIFCSQIANLILTFVTNKVPSFDLFHLIIMIIGGVIGSIIGGKILKKINIKGVDNVFMCLLCVISLICIVNIFKFMK